MSNENLVRKFELVCGDISDYRRLGRYHYRGDKLGPYQAIYALRLAQETAAVIVYSMPAVYVELRNAATGGYFRGYDRRTAAAMVNKNIRTISRVIVEPRFRNIGLATRLVRETMPLLNVRIIEAMAVMGHINPFFEKAGMHPYTAGLCAACLRIKEALSLVGIEEEIFYKADKVHKRIEHLKTSARRFIDREIRRFLQGYPNRRDMPEGPQRTKYVLSKLGDRPVYYIWFNPAKERESREVNSGIL
ncbi:MAG: hypothetical protein WDA68_12160 [Phycisphaerae bacterium]